MADDLPPEWVHDCPKHCEIGEGLLLIHGSASMFIPAGGNHVRQVSLRIPGKLFRGTPTVLATVYGVDNAGDAFAIYNITWNQDSKKYWWCKISAQAANNPNDSEYRCDFALLGRPRS